MTTSPENEVSCAVTTGRDADGRRLRVTAVRASPIWLHALPAVHDAALGRGGEAVLKNEHKTSITRVVHAGCAAIVKHYRPMGLRWLLKGLFRLHPARRSLRAALAMGHRGIPTPPVLGLVERQILGLPAECWLVTEDLPAAVGMDRYILRQFNSGRDAERRRRFVVAFAEVFGRLMRSGVCHRDLKTCNILVREDGDDWSFAFIDLDDAVVRAPAHRMSRDDWVLALAQLNPSTPKIVPWTDRLRFLDRLAELGQWERRPLVAAVQELSRRRRRAYFSDDGPVEEDFV